MSTAKLGRTPDRAARRSLAVRHGVLTSPPTGRVLDVVELLAHRADREITLADIVRELRITRATAHAILATLCDRGWARRDPVGKGYRLGAGLTLAARAADAACSLEKLAAEAARGLASELGVPTSVMQIAGDDLVICEVAWTEGDQRDARPGDRIPYVAPFGQCFIAWDTPEARRAWLARSGLPGREIADRLETVLAAIRRCGYAVQYMSVALARAIKAVSELRQDPIPDALRDIIERLLVEITSLDHLPEELSARKTYPVSAITVPIFDERGRVALNIGVHPFRELSKKSIARIARIATKAGRQLSRGQPPALD